MLDRAVRATEPTVLMLGHNPGIAAFASGICPASTAGPCRFYDYPTCATT